MKKELPEKNELGDKYEIVKEEINPIFIKSPLIEVNKHNTFDLSYLFDEFDSSFTQADYVQIETADGKPTNIDAIGNLLRTGKKKP